LTSEASAGTGSVRVLQIALVVAAIAAFIVVLGLFGTGVRVFCLGVIVVATVIAEPARRSRGGGWWYVLAGGALGSVLGAIIAQGNDTLGGAIALICGLLVISAAAVGFPNQSED
jgi:hypothetical protein